MSAGATPLIVKLENPIRSYAWGSTRAIALLQGRPAPAPVPEAELWIGDHPVASSCVCAIDGDERASVPLSAWVGRDPDRVLGPPPRPHGDALPFLTKVLAAARPLSLQVHPNALQARAGYAREEAAGTPPELRCYTDAHAKYEVLIALSPFAALAGLRPDAEVRRLVTALQSPMLRALLDTLERDGAGAGQPDGLPEISIAWRLLVRLQDLDVTQQRQLCSELAATPEQQRDDGRRAARHWIGRLAALHPDDALVAAPLLMNCVTLAPGEAVVVPPGILHTYLEGVGVEVMTSSDNVVRAGLSGKFVDTAEFRRVASPVAAPVRPLRPTTSDGGSVAHYVTGSPQLDVAVVALGGALAARVERQGARVGVLLCVEGSVAVTSAGAPAVELRSGEAALVPASTDCYALETGSTARIFVVHSGPA